MPTALPFRLPPVRRLTLPETVRFLVLIVRVRWLDRRLHAAHRRVDCLGLDAAGDELLRLARRWLDLHQQIGAMLGISELPHVAIVRATLQPPDEIRRRAAAVPPLAPDRLSQG